MSKIALSITILAIMAFAQAAKVKTTPNRKLEYSPKLEYLSDIVRNTNRNGRINIDKIRKTPNYTKKNVKISSPIPEKSFLTQASEAIKKFGFSKSLETKFFKDAILDLKSKVKDSNNWYQLSMILKNTNDITLRYHQILVRMLEEKDGKPKQYVIVTNNLAVPNSKKLKLESFSSAVSHFASPFTDDKVLYQATNMQALYGSEWYVTKLRTYFNRVSLSQI